jgi:hypothetical protein
MGKEIENRWRSKTKIAQAKIDKEKKLDIKSSLDSTFWTQQSHIVERKQKLQNSFNAITLEAFVKSIKNTFHYL